MTPTDWRHPKILYAVENLCDGEWIQADHVTPFKDLAERRCRAALDHKRVRLVTYRRDEVEKRKFWGEW